MSIFIFRLTFNHVHTYKHIQIYIRTHLKDIRHYLFLHWVKEITWISIRNATNFCYHESLNFPWTLETACGMGRALPKFSLSGRITAFSQSSRMLSKFYFIKWYMSMSTCIYMCKQGWKWKLLGKGNLLQTLAIVFAPNFAKFPLCLRVCESSSEIHEQKGVCFWFS